MNSDADELHWGSGHCNGAKTRNWDNMLKGEQTGFGDEVSHWDLGKKLLKQMGKLKLWEMNSLLPLLHET